MYYILDDNNKPIRVDSYKEYYNWKEQVPGKHPVCSIQVAKTSTDRTQVSTVFLGLDHGYSGKPVLWESMVFSSDDKELDETCIRYTSHEEALKGHKELCEKYL